MYAFRAFAESSNLSKHVSYHAIKVCCMVFMRFLGRYGLILAYGRTAAPSRGATNVLRGLINFTDT